MTTVTELDRVRAACSALCAHVRDVHGVSPSTGSASQVEAQHQAAHARKHTPWHPDAWRLPDTTRTSTRDRRPRPTVTPELRQILRRLKLGKMLDTLPERLLLAKHNQLGHAAFLELVLADEVDRRDRTGAAQRARAAGLDRAMTLQTWQDHDHITYDRDTFAELATLGFVEANHSALILGPVGVACVKPRPPRGGAKSSCHGGAKWP